MQSQVVAVPHDQQHDARVEHERQGHMVRDVPGARRAGNGRRLGAVQGEFGIDRQDRAYGEEELKEDRAHGGGAAPAAQPVRQGQLEQKRHEAQAEGTGDGVDDLPFGEHAVAGAGERAEGRP